MAQRRQTCRFHQQGGCNKGTSCTYLHIGPPGLASTPSTPSSALPVGEATNETSPPPHGACRFYWQTGSCKREYDCRYKHITPNAPTQTAESTTTMGGVQAMSGSSSAGDLSRDILSPVQYGPVEVHNHLKHFMHPQYAFRHTGEMHRFVYILSNINASNSKWSHSDGQGMLTKLADPESPGLLRISDILRYETISPNPIDPRKRNPYYHAMTPNILSFQAGYIPLLSFFGSDIVTKSTYSTHVNALYGLIETNIDHFLNVLTRCMEALLAAKSFGDPELSGDLLFGTIITCLYQYALRFKQAVRKTSFRNLVEKLQSWFSKWVDGIEATPPEFEDVKFSSLAPGKKGYIITQLRRKLTPLTEMTGRIDAPAKSKSQGPPSKGSVADSAAAVRHRLQWDPPGALREEGPRHDNDFENVSNIDIVPTHDELCCPIPPCLPATFHGASHHLPPQSMDRVFDVQFRLYREELIASIRTSISAVLEDLRQPEGAETRVSRLIQNRGGVFKPNDADSAFGLYTNVTVEGLEVNMHKGLCVILEFDAPSQRARSHDVQKRKAYWENIGKKRLSTGGLVALVWKEPHEHEARIYLGCISSSLQYLIDSSKDSEDRVKIQIAFFDKTVESRMFAHFQKHNSDDVMLLIEAAALYDTIRPFLQTLQKREPASVPFARYLTYPATGSLQDVSIDPPAYTTLPDFAFNLSSLFAEPKELQLSPTDPQSVRDVEKALQDGSKLDGSQVDAVMNCLTSEVALIQGPPGTGKSFTGIELLRVLIANNVRPILLVAFTNHALDHILTQVLNQSITEKIIRLGRRSSEEELMKYTLDELLRTPQSSHAKSAAASHYRAMKSSQQEMADLMKTILDASQDVAVEVQELLPQSHPDQYEELINPPFWVSYLYEGLYGDGFEQVGEGGQQSTLDFWLAGRDIEFITPPLFVDRRRLPLHPVGGGQPNRFNALQSETGSSASRSAVTIRSRLEAWREERLQFFQNIDLPGIPPLPSEDRPADELARYPLVWRMSLAERQRLYQVWTDAAQEAARALRLQEFERLKKQLDDAHTRYDEVWDAERLDILRGADIIGCTTNGAAKLTNLLGSVAPKVLLVEEAGQVLEAHVLSSLVPSVQHMILIGDPLQLRPTIANYGLSMENYPAGQLYSFDKSLLERLSDTGLSMSQLHVQRRMRPTISNLVRKTLYPKLQDHDKVKDYPNVRGMVKNLFFVDHTHAEQGNDEASVSKTNMYEVHMIKDLVMHLLRQGTYSSRGDIIVLCAYLGQLLEIKRELSKEVTTVIDERDATQLLNQEGGEEMYADALAEPEAKDVKVSNVVIIRTIDNFQGEEGRVVILSLVRNSGGIPGKTVGFLKSWNRTNVALSRAQEGMYIFGNSKDLVAKSKMWGTVVNELKQEECIGSALPICCNRHPECVNWIKAPGEIPTLSPDGGCLEPCREQLQCGHQCPYKCHSDDPEHQLVKCRRPCQKLCKREHPCRKTCSQPCGYCQFPSWIDLPCGHRNEVRCHQLDSPDSIECQEKVYRKLLFCEHYAEMRCSDDPADVFCTSPCDKPMNCCSRSCKSACGTCQQLSPNDLNSQQDLPRTEHGQHACNKTLYCSHECGGSCSEDHDCAEETCRAKCSRHCIHRNCKKECSTICPPCLEPCLWTCDHHSCPVACGVPCIRLPCDERCTNILRCGHRCPSVCGEPCGNREQICPICASEDKKEMVVDVILQRQLGDVDPDSETLDELLITLKCGHVYTVESLDGICELSKYYTRDSTTGAWSALAPVPVGLQKPPVCPHCRAPITSLRYGRIQRRAELDICEQNVANSARRNLRRIMEKIDKFDSEAAYRSISRHVAADGAMTPESEKKKSGAMEKILKSSAGLHTPTSQTILSSKEIHGCYGLPERSTERWEAAVKPLAVAYKHAIDVAGTSTPHKQTYDSAISSLFDICFEELSHEPEDSLLISSGLVTPEEYALHRARQRSGFAAPPNAAVRFRVEAFWVSMTIRFTLVSILERYVALMPASSKVAELWYKYGIFILKSVRQDGQRAAKFAEDVKSWRQALKTDLFMMESDLSEFSFSTQFALRPGTSQLHSVAARLNTPAAEGLAKAKKQMADCRKRFVDRMRGDLQAQEWAAVNFVEPATRIIERWNELKLKLDQSSGILSNEEMADIVRALSQTTRLRNGGIELGISTRGHFYQCPNGHVYVIGDCGGAMERSRCPECGCTIGGYSHTLDASNSVATEFENVAGAQGLGASPWAWGAGA